jgi:hypothetical protein
MRTLLIFIVISVGIFSCDVNKNKSENESNEIKISDSSKIDNKPNKIDRVDSVINELESEPVELGFLNRELEYPFVTEDSIIGIGIVEISDGPSCYKIYSEEGKIIASVELKENEIITKIDDRIIKGYDSLNPFKPRLFAESLDYFRLVFDCIKKDSNNYKVIINRQTGKTGYIRRNDNSFKFFSIDEYVDNWTGLGLDFDRTNNPLRTTPSVTSDTIHSDLKNRYKIWRGEKILIKGDWMEIQTTKTERGWIRWREGNQILIRMYYSC